MKRFLPLLLALFLCGFTTVSDNAEKSLENLHRRAEEYMLISDFEAALSMYSEILLLEPDDDTAYTGMGKIYLIRGQLRKAHDAFLNALHIHPDNEEAIAGIKAIMDPDGVEGLVRVD